MSALRVAITAVTLAVSISRHPMVRAAVRAAPSLIPEATRLAASDAAKATAYRAGVAAGRLLANRSLSRR